MNPHRYTEEFLEDLPKALEFGRRLRSGEAWRDSPVRKRYFTWYGPILAIFDKLIFPF